MVEQGECKHPGCHCPVPKDRAARGDEYCSDYCAGHGGQAGHAEHACGCGHAKCAA